MRKQGKQDTNSTDFRTVWKVKAGDAIGFNTFGAHTVDWGDGCTEQVKDKYGDPYDTSDAFNELTHRYANAGEYTVTLSNTVTMFCICPKDADKLIDIKQWGRAQWITMSEMFNYARNTVCTATDAPNTSKVTDMSYMFFMCARFNSPIEHWDFKNIENMTSFLDCAVQFNQPLEKIDLSDVWDIDAMLSNTPAFDQDLRKLKINPKANTNHMFNGKYTSLTQHNEKYEALDLKKELSNLLMP